MKNTFCDTKKDLLFLSLYSHSYPFSRCRRRPARLATFWQRLLYGKDDVGLVHVEGFFDGVGVDGEPECVVVFLFFCFWCCFVLRLFVGAVKKTHTTLPSTHQHTKTPT